jgi:type VI protein secretion system component Hcp
MCLAEAPILILQIIPGVLPIEFLKIEKMKKQLLVYSILLITLSAFSQRQFTHTASKENISCNNDCTVLDVTELNNNPAAILFVTPLLEKGVNLNPHPIGAYYFKNKWHIFNLDQKTMPSDATFNVEYVAKPDATHFQYSFKREDIQTDGSAFIDHPSLNNNPTVKFTHFPSWDPNARGSMTSREEITMQYNTAAGKWTATHNNKKPLFEKVTYNISIEAAGSKTTLPPIVTDRVSLPIGELVVPATPTPTNPNAVIGDIVYIYMAAWAGNTKLPGDSKRAAFLEYTELWGLEMGTNNLSGRKNTYEPITIRLHSGSAMMIPLLNAYISKQSMTFQFDALSNSTTGREALNYTIRLTGATIISYRQVFLEEITKGSTTAKFKTTYDEIKVTFTQIEFTNSTGATATDNF